MGENQNAVLKTVLDCGTGDLYMLDGIEYDLDEMVEEMITDGINPTLNNILGNVFRRGVEELAQLISDRLCEPGEDDSEEVLDVLRSLNPEQDISWRCNCRDSGIRFCENEEIFRDYLPEEISKVEKSMGFSF